MQNQSRLEKVMQKLQQQIANDAVNFRTQIALLEVELEEANAAIAELQGAGEASEEESGEDA